MCNFNVFLYNIWGLTSADAEFGQYLCANTQFENPETQWGVEPLTSPLGTLAQLCAIDATLTREFKNREVAQPLAPPDGWSGALQSALWY